MIIDLWNNVNGYVIITVEGQQVERFVNMAIRRDIYLWDIINLGDKKLRMKVSVKGFKKIHPVALKTKCRVKILGKRGTPFVVNRYKHRKAFLAGILIFITLVVYLNSFVWKIDIQGLKEIKRKYVLNLLKDEGLKEGVIKYGMNTKKLQDDFMLKAQGIVWINIKISGNRALVKVVEGTKPPTIVDESKPCNIIAKNSGLIEKTIVKNGKPEIITGDYVIKNQLLISGVVPGSDISQVKYRYVHADGNIYAKTWYEDSITTNYKNIKKINTKSYRNNYGLSIFNRDFLLPFGKVTYKNYKYKKTINKAKIGDDLYLPFGLIKEKYIEQKNEAYTLKKTDIEKLNKNILLKKINRKIPKTAKKVSFKFVNSNTGSGIKTLIVVECIEDIGEERIIKISQ